MKKLCAVALCGIVMIHCTTLANDKSVTADLHTPIRLYANSVINGVERMFAFGADEASRKKEPPRSKAIVLVKDSLNYNNGVVTISPAELLEICISIMSKRFEVDAISGMCVRNVQAIIKSHNDFVDKYTKETTLSADDTSKQICWPLDNFHPRKIFGENYEAFWDVFDPEENMSWFYGCIRMSLTEMRERCEMVLSDPKISESVNADSSTCQKFVEDTLKNHNARIENINSLQTQDNNIN